MDGTLLQDDAFTLDGQPSYAEALRTALQRPRLMDYRFDTVEVIAEERNTIIPMEQFRKGDMVAFYRLCFPDAQVSTIDMQYQLLPSLEVVMLFRVAPELMRTVMEFYPDVKVRCADGELLEHLAVTQRQAEERCNEKGEPTRDLYISVGSNDMFIALFAQGNIVYAASQHATNDDDRLFLLLGIWKALELDAESDYCHLLTVSPTLRDSIREYILNVTEE